MPTDMPESEPVLLYAGKSSDSFELFRPKGEITNLPLNSRLRLLCSGSGNVINAIKMPSVDLVCGSNGAFATAAGKKYLLKQLGCKSIPSSSLLLTSDRCASGQGYIFKAGFEYDDNEFAPVFSICYDNATEHTFYSQNVINGAAINYAVTESTRRSFRANGMRLTTTATNSYYTKKNQIALFEKYFGKSQTYVDNIMYLARGHLSPDADFIFGYEQLATYFYANVVPEFQIINAGNWIRVENAARDVAAGLRSDLLTFTSSFGILKLPNSKGTLISVYLDDKNNINVPKWLYKVLISSQLKENLVLITLNNPFASAADAVEFCPNVCADYDLDREDFTDTTKGYTFCCTLSDFQNAVDDLPTFDLPEGWTL